MRSRTHRPRIVLAGGGHAHLHTLRRTGELTRRGFDVALVDPSPHLYYSGMATGVISGSYAPGDNRIDVRRLVERGGGCFVEGRVWKVLDRTLILEDGRQVRYDAVSFCVGSETHDATPTRDGIVPVKPVENTPNIRDHLLAFEGGVPRLLVLGGGPAGCEVAANAASLMRDRGLAGKVTLAEAGPDLLGASPRRARRLVLSHLRTRGVEVLLDCRVEPNSGGAVTRRGQRIEADLVVTATGVSPPDLFLRSGLRTGEGGGLWVDRCLRSPDDARVFGGGDSASYGGGELPRLGVFAVRQGPTLYHNLQAVLRDVPLVPFKPQKRYLYVLNLGDGTGLAIYGPLSHMGRLPMRLKHLIDTRFVEEYR